MASPMRRPGRRIAVCSSGFDDIVEWHFAATPDGP